MLTIFTLELFNSRSHFSKVSDFGKRSKLDSEIKNRAAEQKITKEISKEKYEKMENFIILLPLLILLLGIIVMYILQNIFT